VTVDLNEILQYISTQADSDCFPVKSVKAKVAASTRTAVKIVADSESEAEHPSDDENSCDADNSDEGDVEDEDEAGLNAEEFANEVCGGYRLKYTYNIHAPTGPARRSRQCCSH
jgi:hypothetical protein